MPYTPLNDAHTPPNAADTPFIDAETVRAVLHLKEKWQAEIRGQLREAEAERDSWRRVAERIEGENQALAAHVKRLREALHQALVHWGAHCPDEDGAAYAECEKRCDESPTTSLAAEDSWHDPTIRQVREMCEGLTGNQIRHALDGMLKGHIAEYRRQAEGETND